MDMQQKPLATAGCKHYNNKGVLMYESLIDFSDWTETVSNPRNGKFVRFQLERRLPDHSNDRNVGRKIARLSAGQNN
jgi:hypothetical protein